MVGIVEAVLLVLAYLDCNNIEVLLTYFNTNGT